MVSALQLVSFFKQKLWWKTQCTCPTSHTKDTEAPSTDMMCPEIPAGSNKAGSFLNSQDLCVLHRFSMFSNRPFPMLMLTLPAVVAITLCPLTLACFIPLVTSLWPPDQHPVIPNVNKAIACFLMPSGLIYAISFGFAYQEAVRAHHATMDGISKVAMLTNQLASLAVTLQDLSSSTKARILGRLKQVVLVLMLPYADRVGKTCVAAHHRTQGTSRACGTYLK